MPFFQKELAGTGISRHSQSINLSNNNIDINHYNPPINFRVILLATLRHVV